MTLFRLTFAGQIKKAEHRTAGTKPIVEIQMCRKNGKGDDATFTWVRVTVWEPAEWLAPKLVVGAFVAGSGDFQLRSYEKDGVKRQSAEIRCSSFDIEVGDAAPAGDTAPAPAPAPKPRAPAAAPAVNDADIPF